MAATWLLLVYMLVLAVWTRVVYSETNPQDGAVLRSLKDQWGNTPPSWDKSNDPCADWDGVSCNNTRVTSLGLSTMGLTGLKLPIFRDLSFNPGLTGSLSPRLGDLKKLTILILAGCSFTNNIPSELGNLSELTFLALNSNNFTGDIPQSFGKLSKLYWLDLAENQLTGQIPVSSILSGPGLDNLKKAKHFHFNKNRLSGEIPAQLFDSDMSLIHVLFDGNQFEGRVPNTVALVQTLEVLRLDRNGLDGNVPPQLNNLTNLIELNLAHNVLSGPLPNLTGMNSLNYVDLSNNSFRKSDAPDWFTTLQSLTTLVIEYGPLEGSMPSEVFNLPQIGQVKLRNNAFSDNLNMSVGFSQQLQLIDLESNDISSVTLGSTYKNTLMLIGNPVCSTSLENTVYCQIQQSAKPYSTSLANCGSQSCTSDQKLNPQSCECSYPYEGTLYFRAPSFRDLSNASLFHSLELSLWLKLNLSPGSVSLQNPFFNVDDYLQVQLGLFPYGSKYFNRSEVRRIGFSMSNQSYKPPKEFGPYYFIASPYVFGDGNERTHVSTGVVVGITFGCVFLFVALAGIGIYALRQKKRAEQAISLSKPFASWAPSGKDSGGAPQLKGARWFSYDELKKSTNNFSQSNQIGSGGYGKVYRGMLSSGQIVAIKRAQQGSTQASQEKCSATARPLIQDDLPKRNNADTYARYVPDFINYSNWSGFDEDLSPQPPDDDVEWTKFYLTPEPSDVYPDISEYDDSDELSPQPSDDYFGESEYDDSDDLSPQPSDDYFGESEYDDSDDLSPQPSEYDGAEDHDSELSSHASDDYYDVSEHGVTDLSPQPAETIAFDNYTFFD
ncbi:hypothetical protein RD792_013277 [Penstemon davidsonii]|uniref:non-specific serine/threonine protein kinase n=1 Tax=Penstemon davidsonii TaxID=160366 RepID=A0ABR0CTJ0_9LAMI|nr:hypothetical protein RD792_013277 [Penstemon davidsonii]